MTANLIQSHDVITGHHAAEPGCAAILASENYGAPIEQWSAGSSVPGLLPAVLRPALHDLTLEGSGVKGRPADNVGLPDQYHGLLLDASGATVENLHVFDIPGTAGVFNRPANPRSGQMTANDLTEHSLRRLSAYRVYRGFEFRCADGGVSDVRVSNFRDWGVTFAGAIDATDVHVWGGVGPGIIFGGGQCRARGLVAENTTVGIAIDGSANHIDGVRLFTCWETGLVIRGKWNRATNLHVESSVPLGVRLANQWNTVTGTISTTHEGTCVQIDNGVGQRIDATLAMYGRPDAKGLVTTAPLQCCTIDLVIDGGGVGADFSAGLGACNIINIRTRSVAEPVVMPKAWPSSNEISVNGVRL